MSKILTFTTPQYKSYKVRIPDGALVQKNRDWSGNWLLLGIRHTRNTRTFIPLAQLVEMLEAGQSPELTFRTTGNPQWTVVDLDYGTRRMWGNARYHGIRFLNLEEV